MLPVVLLERAMVNEVESDVTVLLHTGQHSDLSRTRRA